PVSWTGISVGTPRRRLVPTAGHFILPATGRIAMLTAELTFTPRRWSHGEDSHVFATSVPKSLLPAMKCSLTFRKMDDSILLLTDIRDTGVWTCLSLTGGMARTRSRISGSR